ncbi:MAG: PorT family protein [Bacteroidales bacterium]|nr:PorT family protein [Bacteroidales bacterium]
MKSKYKVLIFIIGLIVLAQYHTLYSQNPRDPRKFSYNTTKTPTIGLKGGVLLSTITGDEAIDQYAKNIGPQIGLTGAFYLHPMLSARAELNYEPKGGKFVNHDMEMNLHYASLPVYFKFNFTPDPEIYIYAGGYASYLIAAKTKGTYEIIIGDDYITQSINEDILPNLNKFDAGIIIGMGVQGRFNSRTDIFLDFRYTQGFINLDNGSAELRYNFNYEAFWPEQDLDKPKNKAFMLTTGLIIYLDPR